MIDLSNYTYIYIKIVNKILFSKIFCVHIYEDFIIQPKSYINSISINHSLTFIDFVKREKNKIKIIFFFEENLYKIGSTMSTWTLVIIMIKVIFFTC